MLPENPSFMVRGDDGVEYGPVELDELRDWVQENRAGLGTDVRRDEPGARWSPWQTHPELVALLAEVQVTAGAPVQPATSLAPMGRRVLAFALDLILVSFLVSPVFIALALIYLPDWCVQYAVAAANPPFVIPEVPRAAEICANLISDLMLALYFTLYLAAHGKTPAKQLFRLRVVDQAGLKPSLVKSLLRALAMIFSMGLFFLPFTYAFFNPQRRALHDVIAGTWVVEA
jgi:uncharacterized RDD family membrane protein YckC